MVLRQVLDHLHLQGDQVRHALEAALAGGLGAGERLLAAARVNNFQARQGRGPGGGASSALGMRQEMRLGELGNSLAELEKLSCDRFLPTDGKSMVRNLVR